MRIRSIRPEFWSSEDVAAMDWHTRLVYIGLWSYVDDNGVGRDIERLITTALFPLDDDFPESSRRVTGALRHLSDHCQITRYTVNRKRFLHIDAWATHQRIEKASKGRYPLPTCDDAVIPEPSPTTPVALPDISTLGEGEKGRRGEGEKVNPLSDTSDEFEKFWTLYPKKVNKKAAKAKWLTVVRSTDPSGILAGITAQLPQMKITEERFIPAPDVWLNKGKWADEIQAPVKRIPGFGGLTTDERMARGIPECW